MRITLKLADGSRQTLEVESIQTNLNGASIEFTLHDSPPRLRITSPGDHHPWHRFVLHPSAANVMEFEVCSHGVP